MMRRHMPSFALLLAGLLGLAGCAYAPAPYGYDYGYGAPAYDPYAPAYDPYGYAPAPAYYPPAIGGSIIIGGGSGHHRRFDGDFGRSRGRGWGRRSWDGGGHGRFHHFH
jgi:hypothetical protein